MFLYSFFKIFKRPYQIFDYVFDFDLFENGSSSSSLSSSSFSSSSSYSCSSCSSSSCSCSSCSCSCSSSYSSSCSSSQSSTAFLYKRSVTIDSSKVYLTDETNFPVLVSFTDATLKDTGHSGHVTSVSGYDIEFYATSDLSGTKLDHEIESYDGTTGTIVMWVRIPTVSNTDDTIFYMVYGNSNITTSQENKAGVWDSNFKGVYHLSDPTDPKDSTGVNNGTNHGVDAATGNIDGGGTWVAASKDYIDVGDMNNVLDGINKMTISLWIKAASIGAWAQTVNKYVDDQNYFSLSFGDGATSSFSFAVANATTNAYGNSALADFTLGQWGYVVVLYDGTTTGNANRVKMYINGSQKTLTFSGTIPSTTDTNSSPVQFGIRSGTSLPIGASMDEIRISVSARSENWIKTEYNNQYSPSTFCLFGEETGP